MFLIIGWILLFDMFIIEPYSIRVREENLIVNKLPSELKVAVISDFHLRPFKNYPLIDMAANKLNQIKPDIIIIAGDFLFYDHLGWYKNDLANFKKISLIAPTFAVLGNHDYGLADMQHTIVFNDQHKGISSILENAGIKILQDAKIKMNISGKEFWLVGFDEYWNLKSQPSKALTGLNDNLLKICASHNPDIAYLPETKILDILVSGHTHGGQIRLPFIGPLVDAQTLFPKQDYGKLVTNHEPKILNTSGIGESGLPIRFFDWPEIVILNIK